MAAGLGILALAPGHFWAMTPKELDAALRGRLGGSKAASGPTRIDLTALMSRFPDQQTP
jgi:uncharacterized phage protein (TIGR02216 family)